MSAFPQKMDSLVRVAVTTLTASAMAGWGISSTVMAKECLTRSCRPVTGTGMCPAAMPACLPCQHQRRSARPYSARRMDTSLRGHVRTSSVSALEVWGMSSTVMMDSSSTLPSQCVTGHGTTPGVATLQIQPRIQIQQPPAQPQPQLCQRNSAPTTAPRLMECLERDVVSTLTASALVERDSFTIVLLGQSLILSWDFVMLLLLLSAVPSI